MHTNSPTGIVPLRPLLPGIDYLEPSRITITPQPTERHERLEHLGWYRFKLAQPKADPRDLILARLIFNNDPFQDTHERVYLKPFNPWERVLGAAREMVAGLFKKQSNVF